MIAFPRLRSMTRDALYHVTGGGIAFTNLFKDWPKDCFACVHSDAVPI